MSDYPVAANRDADDLRLYKESVLAQKFPSATSARETTYMNQKQMIMTRLNEAIRDNQSKITLSIDIDSRIEAELKDQGYSVYRTSTSMPGPGWKVTIAW